MIFSPSLSEASDVLQKAPTLIIGLAESLHSPSGWVALALVLVWFLVNKDLAHLFSLFERKQRRRFELLEQYYLRPEITDEKTRTALGELRDTIYFKAVAGIYAERKFRHALIELHQHTSYKISWNQVRRALPYIQMDAEGMAFVRNFSMGERFGYRYNQLIHQLLSPYVGVHDFFARLHTFCRFSELASKSSNSDTSRTQKIADLQGPTSGSTA